MDIGIKKKWFVTSNDGNIKEYYDFHEELGNGAYGSVVKATHKQTGQERAVKIIPKNRVKDYESFKTEVGILRDLDHPNILKVFETFETDRLCYLVSEICNGGELFYHITKTKHLTEAQCAQIMKQIISALMYCHANNVCHRDLKPENFLLKEKDDDSNIKLIDFGLSKQLKQDEIMNTPNGTPYYIAPEVLSGEYCKECDNWSLGVLLYIMLSGCPPFYGPSNQHILKAVMKGTYSLNLKPFKNVSDEAKDLIKKLLVKDANQRLTAEEAYNHPWIQRQVSEDNANIELDPEVFANMSDFVQTQKFKKAALTLIAAQIPEDQIESLKKSFVKMDANGDGTLTFEELRDGMHELSSATGQDVKEEDLRTLMKAMDTNGNGTLDYTEFLAVCMQSYSYLKDSNLKAAFAFFDKDGNGKITKDEILEIMGTDVSLPLDENEVLKMIEECDIDGDGTIDYNEFMKVMQGKM